ncbi:hypothetical protein MK805_08560 [Shimazuella sp. AN120528]|uniref:hypothetical protein n=1 Tax=Shimazuella soli TaxID=1892854 RepID=UPI001F100EF3|nr:hypothetical protein [Shimazuella soli]MCH5585021.1 hypothetical protein [Shimazuella soli]
MLQNIHTWFSSLNWAMWSGIGQWFSGIVTLITVWFLWKQTKSSQQQTDTSLQQTQLAVQQMEEARQRELEASKPEIRFTADEIIDDNFEQYICLYINNIKKDVPLTIQKHHFRQHFTGYRGQKAKNMLDTQRLLDHKAGELKKLNYGDFFEVKFNVKSLISTVQPREQALFTYQINTTTGDKFECSLLIAFKEEQNIDGQDYKFWTISFMQGQKLTIKDLRQKGEEVTLICL